MFRNWIVIALLGLIFQTFGREHLRVSGPGLWYACDILPIYIRNPNAFDVELEYGTEKFQVIVENHKESYMLEKLSKGDTCKIFTFKPGWSDIYLNLSELLDETSFKNIKVILDGYEVVHPACYAIELTSCNVTNNCDGSYTAEFEYENLSSSSMKPVVNYFTDSREKEIASTMQPVDFAGGSKGSFSIVFTGTHITWHLDSRTLTATAASATNSCGGGCLDNTVPMDDFYYRPYPVLAVHGYNATPETFGDMTYKEDEKDEVFVSTKRKDHYSDKSTLVYKIYEKIHGTGSSKYKDYAPSDADSYWGSLNAARIFPYEEDGSYTGLNHTFVESYSSNYAYESDDATEAKILSPYFGADCNANPNSCYKLTEFQNRVGKIYGSPYGGQTQLVRMRIVQLLNEYYGDWKWLHDPTAKIDIVCHSNGGLIVTNALANDEHYYNNGKSKEHPIDQYYLNGLGVRLADHVNKVITIDTPFEGSPLSRSDVGFETKYSIYQYRAVDLILTAFEPLIEGLTAFPGGVVCYFLMKPLLQWIINEEIVQKFCPTGTPLNRSMAPGSAFLQSTKSNGIAPALSDQTNYAYFSSDASKKINYVNYIGIMDGWGAIFSVIASVPSSWFVFEALKCVFVFTCRPQNLYVSGKLTSETIMLAKWFFESDGIVSVNSQKMTSIYNDVDPTRYKQFKKYSWKSFHSCMPETVEDKVIKQLNDKPELKLTHVIGENQISMVDENDTTIFIPREKVNEDAVFPNDCVVLHPIASFKGMNNSDPALKWPQKDQFYDVIRTNNASGKAVKVVGYIKNAFMNQVAMCAVVNGKIYEMQFGTHFGKWASRSIDRDGNGFINDKDWPGGSWFFTPDLSCDINEGENNIEIIAKPLSLLDDDASLGNRDTIIATVKVICGKSLDIFEADRDGHRIESIFFNKPMRWDINGNESKRIDFGFNDIILRSTAPSDRDGISIKAGEADPCMPPNELHFREATACNIVDPGEFCLSENPLMDLHLLGSFKLDPSYLRKSGGMVTTEQLLHFRFVDKSEGTWSNAYIPFYIDNEKVEIRLFNPPLKGDYNDDGIANGSDYCIIRTGIEQVDCDTVCTAAGLDPSSEECVEVVEQCNNSNTNTSVVKRPECDGIDNDLDGYTDIDDDISEMTRMPYYSPKYDDDTISKLISEPVMINFSITDNLQSLFNKPKKIQIRVYKVNGDEHSPHDKLLFVDDYKKDGHGDPVTFGDITYIWPFTVNQEKQIFDKNNPPPNGLYCVTINGLDIAGVESTNDEVFSEPAYFIVDRTPPSFTILQNWHDFDTKEPVLKRTTTKFLMNFRPGPADLSGYFSDKFDSETSEFEILFHAKYNNCDIFSNIPGGYYRISSIPPYKDDFDNDKYINSELNGIDVGDNIIDPVTCEILANQKWIIDRWARLFSIPDLPGGQYTVQYVAKDKAGNITTQHDTNFVITIERDENHIPVLIDDKLGIFEPEEITDIDGNKVSKTTQNSEDDNDPTTDEGNISYYSVKGDTLGNCTPVEMTIRVDSLKNTGDNAEIGLAIRNSTINDDVMAEIVVDDDGNIIFTSRTVRGTPKVEISRVSQEMISGLLLRIKRDNTGNVIGSYSIDNGNTFINIGSTMIGKQDVIIGVIHRQTGSPTEDPGTAKVIIINKIIEYGSQVIPVLNEVINNCDGTYTAFFGYNNPNDETVVLPHGSKNKFIYKGKTVDILNRTSRFEPGNKSNDFSVKFDGSPLVWHLNGTTVTANSVSGDCDPVIIPNSVSGYAVYGLNQVDIADRAKLICGTDNCAVGSGSGNGVTTGVESKVGSIESRGQITLRNYAKCSDFAISSQKITLQQGAVCPVQNANYSFSSDVLPLSAPRNNFLKTPKKDFPLK